MNYEALTFEEMVKKYSPFSLSGIKYLNIDFADHLCWSNGLDPWSAEGSNFFFNYCKNHGIYYYARVNEDFDPAEALRLAIADGAKYLLPENLS
jgi:hypothetical protein